jgi:signal transduction histidine kinase/CheY-like chemotaxis protein
VDPPPGTLQEDRQRRVAVLIAVACVVALGLVLVVIGPRGAVGVVMAGAILVLAAACGVGLAVLFYRESTRRSALGKWAAGTEELLRSVGVVLDAEHGEEAAEELISILLERIRSICDADTATALVLSDDGSELLVRMSVGWADPPTVGEPAGPSGRLTRVLSLGHPIVLEAQEGDEPLRARRGGGVPGLAGCALTANDQIIGALLIGKAEDAEFGDYQLRLLQMGAARLASALDRSRLGEAERRSRLSAEHARRQVELLSEASFVLASALDDYRSVLGKLSATLVPGFGDFCLVDVRRPDGTSEVVVRKSSGDDASPQAFASDAGTVPAVRDARLWYVGVREVDGLDRYLAQLGQAEQLTSVMVAPIRVDRSSVGALVLGTKATRRGFRESDLRVAKDLAQRTGIAVERVWLYQGVRRAGDAAVAAADRLRRLAIGELVISGALTETEVLNTATSSARSLFAADGARARYETEDGVLLTAHAGGPQRPDGADNPDGLDELLDQVASTNKSLELDAGLAVPLADGKGVVRGALAVIRHLTPFDADDASVLVMLAQTASISLEKAALVQALSLNQYRLEAWFDASPVGIIELSLDGKVLQRNRAAQSLVGWPLAVESDEEAERGPGPPWLGPLLASARSGQRTVGVTVELSERILDVSCVPLGEQPERPSSALIVVSDTTERHHLEATLRDAQRTEAIVEMAGGVAHDFNNLLTVILGYTGLLLPMFEADDRRKALLESVELAGQRAAALTNQLLTIGRRQVAKPEFVDPGALIASLLDVIERVSGVDVQVRLSGAPAPGTVLIDPGQLEQVVLNLVLNARDAMPGGGLLDLATTREGDDGDWVVIEVTDTGGGMDATTEARCFEPFFTTKARRQGTGLGLAAVKGIVDQAGGSVEVESRLGQGTTFRVRLPYSERSGDESVPVVDAGAAQAGTEVIMVVEDDDDVRRLATSILEARGYTVMTAASAVDARTLFTASGSSVDLLLTDVVLPGVRGPELAEQLRVQSPQLRVLYMSGYTGADGTSNDVLASGDFLAKPFTPEQLAQSVRQALGEHQGVAQGTNR